MNLIIRRVVSTDAEQLVSVIQASLGDEVSVSHAEAIIELDERLCYVAQLDDEVVGFIDGFPTRDASGNVRYELDLLGVLPAMQGHGIGKQLVSQFIDGVYLSAGTPVIRALVSHSNEPMQRVMQQLGFVTSYDLHDLLIRPLASRSGTGVLIGHLVPVRTLTYTGIWIECPLDDAVIHAAERLGSEQNLDIAGRVVSSTDADGISSAITYGFEEIGSYHWWMLTQRTLRDRDR